MAGTVIDGGRVVVEGTAVGGATLIPTIEAGVVALVSMVKFLRLLKNKFLYVEVDKCVYTAISQPHVLNEYVCFFY